MIIASVLITLTSLFAIAIFSYVAFFSDSSSSVRKARILSTIYLPSFSVFNSKFFLSVNFSSCLFCTFFTIFFNSFLVSENCFSSVFELFIFSSLINSECCLLNNLFKKCSFFMELSFLEIGWVIV